MSTACAVRPRIVGARGDHHRDRARASLAAGRHAEALEALRRVRRFRLAVPSALLALQEAEALFGLLRHREALEVASRALRRGAEDADLAARLRVVRGRAMWLTGRVGSGRSEILKAAARACEPLTRARAFETLALFDWREQDLDSACRHLGVARSIYEETASVEGLIRVFEREARVRRDAGLTERAFELLARRIEVASRTPRLDLLAAARSDRGDLLRSVGRWREAREELDEAARLFRQVSDPREVVCVGVQRAALDVAAGDLAAAESALEHARKALGNDGGDPRLAAEVQLVLSDLYLAAGEAAPSAAAAAEALRLFGPVRDPAGESRARSRLAHALVGLMRPREALREARRSLRAAPASRRELQAAAHLAAGRALLRLRRSEAVARFERAVGLCELPSGTLHAARLGRALARRPDRDREVARCLRALEMWGDRRIESLCLKELRELTTPGPTSLSPAIAAASPAREVEALVSAAVALAAEREDWTARWAAALRAVHSHVPFHRAALVGEEAWELGPEGPPAALEGSDVAKDVAASLSAPSCLVFEAEAVWRDHPQRALHGLREALVVPAGPGRTLYLERREGARSFGEAEVGLAAQLGRLIAAFPPAGGDGPASEPTAFSEIVGRCPAMTGLFEQIAKVAPSRVVVHVYGETGTGKERVARALHHRSPRRGGPFAAINASSLSDDLFEAEMFGHARGAFTGAVAEREGHVASAAGGTLFIDEVADLTLRAQSKLLRFLEDGEYRRLGESATRRADVRVVTAANVDLRERVARGAFREDLFYRLTPVTLSLPPLRARGGDLVLLARHFLREAAAREGLAARALPGDVLRALQAHTWPGNVRELQNEMKRLLVLAAEGRFRREHLSPRVLGATQGGRAHLRSAVAEFERHHIGRVLGENGAIRSRTAAALGLSRQALLAKMKRLGL